VRQAIAFSGLSTDPPCPVALQRRSHRFFSTAVPMLVPRTTGHRILWPVDGSSQSGSSSATLTPILLDGCAPLRPPAVTPSRCKQSASDDTIIVGVKDASGPRKG